MNVVCNWVGSINFAPKYFSLSVPTSPTGGIYPDENLELFSETALAMLEQENRLPLSVSDQEVSFYEGQYNLQQLEETIVESTSLAEDNDLFPISVQPPSVFVTGKSCY